MTGFEIADILTKYGPWGLCAVLMLTVWRLYADGQKVGTEDRERLIQALAGAKDAANGVTEALRGVRAILEARGQERADLGAKFDALASDTRHTINNLAASFDAVAKLYERERDNANRDRDRGRS